MVCKPRIFLCRINFIVQIFTLDFAVIKLAWKLSNIRGKHPNNLAHSDLEGGGVLELILLFKSSLYIVLLSSSRGSFLLYIQCIIRGKHPTRLTYCDKIKKMTLNSQIDRVKKEKRS